MPIPARKSPSEDIMKGYKVDTDTYIEVSKDELDDIALESTRTIEIDEFVPKSDIDNRYLIRPYYLVPDGKVGHDAFAVIRETIRSMNKVAIGRVVLTNREHIIALEPLDKGLMGTLLRYPYEVRSEKEYFDDIQDVKVTKDMLDLARHIVEKKSGSFEPEQVRGPLRIGADRPHQPKTQRRPHHRESRAEIRRQRHQSDGRAKAQPRQREAVRPCPPRPRTRSRASASKASARCCCRSAAKRAKEEEPEEGREAGARACPIEKGGIGVRALVAAQDESGRKRRGFATSAAAGLRCHGRRRSMSRLRSAAVASSQRCSTPPITS